MWKDMNYDLGHTLFFLGKNCCNKNGGDGILDYINIPMTRIHFSLPPKQVCYDAQGYTCASDALPYNEGSKNAVKNTILSSAVHCKGLVLVYSLQSFKNPFMSSEH